MSFLDFDAKNLPADLASGAVSGLVAIPDAIASAFLAGANPTYAFNALMTGSPIGSLLSGSQFMNIGLTSAMMLAIADTMATISSENYLTALFTLAVLIGAFQLLLGLLKLGKTTKFISNSVIVGLISGIAIVVILGQLTDMTGYSSEARGTITRALDTLLHFSEWDMPTVIVSIVTIVLLILISRVSRLANFAIAIAMIVGSAIVFILGLDSVELVGDVAQISASFPTPVLPDLTMFRRLALPAVAIGLIGLIQGSSISQSVPNPDGEYADASRDFSAQGIANMISGLFQGLPLGGSLGLTSVIKSTGGRSRWANVFVGVFVLIFVLFFGDVVELVAMPTVGAILFVVGFQILKPDQIKDVWDVDITKRLVMIITFIFALTLPVQQAIMIGVFISFMEFIYTASKLVQLSELHPTEQGTFKIESPPSELPSNQVTILHSRGSTYFAAARTLQDLLPSAKKAQNAVVIMRLRGSEVIGSTFILVMERYAAELRANGGRLMLSGVHQNVLDQLLRTETTESVPEDAIHVATDILGESTKNAMVTAQAWLDAKESTPEEEVPSEGPEEEEA